MPLKIATFFRSVFGIKAAVKDVKSNTARMNITGVKNAQYTASTQRTDVPLGQGAHRGSFVRGARVYVRQGVPQGVPKEYSPTQLRTEPPLSNHSTMTPTGQKQSLLHAAAASQGYSIPPALNDQQLDSTTEAPKRPKSPPADYPQAAQLEPPENSPSSYRVPLSFQKPEALINDPRIISDDVEKINDSEANAKGGPKKSNQKIRFNPFTYVRSFEKEEVDESSSFDDDSMTNDDVDDDSRI